MSEQRKPISRKFQKFIAVARVMTEPELKVMKPREGETDGTPYCRVFCSTGSAWGTSSDAVFTVELRGKNAEMFCSEPRKGHDFLFESQLRTYKFKREGSTVEETRTEFIGSFNFVEPREKQQPAGQTEKPTLPIKANAPQAKTDEDIPF